MADNWREDALLAIIGSRQYENWGSLRHLDANSTEVALRVEKFCNLIVHALLQPMLSNRERQEAEARRVTEEERRRQEAETKRRLEEAEVGKRQQDNNPRKPEKETARGERATRTRIFISYRREADAAYAGWIADRLEQDFGPDHVFRDVDAMRLGVPHSGSNR
jgi:hypothetical protein